MPNNERASVLQRAQIGAENLSTKGTAVSCLVALTSMSIMPSPEIATFEFRPTGQLWRSVTARGKDSSKASISGGATYNELPYLLAGGVKSTTGTIPATGAITREWSFAPANAGSDDYQTYTLQFGDKNRAAQVTALTITEFGFAFSRDEVAVSGAAIGQLFSDGVQMSQNEIQAIVGGVGPVTAGSFTLTLVNPVTGGTATTGQIAYNATAGSIQTALLALAGMNAGDVVCTGGNLPGTSVLIEYRNTLRQLDVAPLTTSGTTGLTGGTFIISTSFGGTVPSTIALVPVVPDISVYMDAAAGNVGVTKLSRVMATGFKVSGRRAPLWVLDAAQTSWVTTVDTEPTAEMTLSVEADSEGMALLDRMRDKSTRYFRIEVLGGTIEGALRYRLWIDVAGQVKSIGSLADSGGVYAAEFTIVSVADSTWGYPFRVQVRNTLVSL